MPEGTGERDESKGDGSIDGNTTLPSSPCFPQENDLTRFFLFLSWSRFSLYSFRFLVFSFLIFFPFPGSISFIMGITTHSDRGPF